MELDVVFHYLLQERVGYGKYGSVYYAIDILNNKPVAIKVTSKKELAKREAAVMLLYGKSPYLPEIYDYFSLNGKSFIVMEHIDGNILGENFEAKRKKSGEQLGIRTTLNILTAIDHLHKNGFVHYDLKPSNIIIHKSLPDSVKIIDFNLAKRINSKDLIQRDLYRTIKICLYLINGEVPPNLKYLELANKKLESVLINALNKEYQSAIEFIDALSPFQ